MADEVSSSGMHYPVSAENLFSDFITRMKRGDHAEIDDLCLEYPEHEEDLRRRYRSWQIAGRALKGLGIEPPLSSQAPKTDRPISFGATLPAPAPEVYSSRYSIGFEIGRGGMGSILSVTDQHLHRKLAMKVLRGKEALYLGKDGPLTTPHDLARFLEEARITGGLQHPNIVPVYELGADPSGMPYFTMKLVEGRTFQEVLPLARAGREGWNVERALGVLLRVCQAVGYAHDKDVIHRDLKPSNLMVGRFGEVYVMDWGLARDFSRPEILRPEDAPPEAPSSDGSSSFRTRDGEVIGTPEYMAPEQAAGNRDEVGSRADVYSMGAILYELLTGQSPNANRGRSAAHVRIAAAIGGAPREVSSVAPQTPAELCAICERAIARSQDDRYPGMIELADDLEAYLEGRVVKAYATGAWAEFRKWIQRNTLVASLAGTMAAIVGIGLIVISALALRVSDQKKTLETKSVELAVTNSDLETKSVELAETNKVLQTKSVELAETNKDLQTKSVELAETNKDLQLKTLEATRSADAAKKRADEVLQLSLSEDYEDLVLMADELWPAHPDKLEDLRAWVAKATALTEKLPMLANTLEELEAIASERTPEERHAERESHPEFERLAPMMAAIAGKKRMLAVRRGEAELQLPKVDWSRYPSDPRKLRDMAFGMVSPARKTFGQEALGLAIALRSHELEPDREMSWISDTVTWARLAVGDGEGVLEDVNATMEKLPEDVREQFAWNLEKFGAEVAKASSSEGFAPAEAEVAAFEAELAELEVRLNERRVWKFDESAGEQAGKRWWHNQLSGLISELNSLETVGTGLLVEEAVSGEHGWSVPRRLHLAERLHDSFEPGGESFIRWERDLPDIRAAYPGLVLTVQMGLVPIGPDPDSNLWEFWSVPSGTEPLRGADGKLQMEETSGLVFVLIPGGEFWMGAQSIDPDGRNYDRDSGEAEGPVHEVELSAFFLSKYEMTQGQWKRMTGFNPSLHGPDGRWSSNWVADGSGGGLLQPVTGISWHECNLMTKRWGLTMPTEAQWEYGSRAETSTVFWSGSAKENLQGVANLEDKYAQENGAPMEWEFEEWLNDGYTIHAPVDHLQANRYGILNVHGNVWEWCRDVYEADFYRRAETLNPVNENPDLVSRVFRGGGFGTGYVLARSAYRGTRAAVFADIYVGFRPAARVTTE